MKNKPNFKLVIFDFDGTIADSLPWLISVLDHVADKFHFPRVAPDEIDAMRAMDPRNLIKLYRVPFWKVIMMGRYIQKLMAADIHNIPLFQGMTELLHELSEKGIILTIVSSNSKFNILQALGPEVSSLFQHYECGVSIFGKSGKLKKVLKKYNTEPAEALCIGDEFRDMDAARTVNVPFGAVTWGYTSSDAMQSRHPNFTFFTVDEISTAIIN